MADRKYNYQDLIAVANGSLSSGDIARILGWPVKTVQKVMLKLDLPRRVQGPKSGEGNQSWKGGRVIDLDGYCLVPAPLGHPRARKRASRQAGRILEHRLVMEQKIGRYLLPEEVVDHIDGNTLNNDPANLRLFANNGEHLRETLAGCTPEWSELGKHNIKGRALTTHPRVDTYGLNKKQGEIRKQRIRRAHAQLDIENPYQREMLLYLRQAYPLSALDAQELGELLAPDLG